MRPCVPVSYVQSIMKQCSRQHSRSKEHDLTFQNVLLIPTGVEAAKTAKAHVYYKPEEVHNVSMQRPPAFSDCTSENAASQANGEQTMRELWFSSQGKVGYYIIIITVTTTAIIVRTNTTVAAAAAAAASIMLAIAIATVTTINADIYVVIVSTVFISLSS